jgi:hypothetical protein
MMHIGHSLVSAFADTFVYVKIRGLAHLLQQVGWEVATEQGLWMQLRPSLEVASQEDGTYAKQKHNKDTGLTRDELAGSLETTACWWVSFL